MVLSAPIVRQVRGACSPEMDPGNVLSVGASFAA